MTASVAQKTAPTEPGAASGQLPSAPVVATAWLAAVVLLGLVDVLLEPFLATPRTLELLALRTLYGLSSLLALGVVFAALAGLGAWMAGRARVPLGLTLFAYAAAGTVLANAVLGRVLWRQADSALDGRFATPLFCVFVAGLGSTLFAAHWLGAFVSERRWLRLAALVLVAGALVGNHFVYRDDYPESHATAGVASALLAGAAIAPWLFAKLVQQPRALRGIIGAFCALALVSGLGPTPNAVRKELFRSPGATGAWALAMTLWEVEDLPPAAAPRGDSRFFRAVSSVEPKVLPTRPPLLLSGPPVVVFITIDAVRADALADRSGDAQWPAIAALRQASAELTHARSPGSQTAVSLTATFAGRLLSEMRWAKYGVGKARFDYAAADPSPRFPALLAAEGVTTTKVAGVNFLANEYGTAAGFESEKIVSEGRTHARASDVERELVARLRAAGGGPLFAYAHFMEPHAPYDRGAVNAGPKKQRYLSEIAAMDGSIQRITELLENPRFRGRSFLIVSSDHGEAFGEHGYWEHAKSLYEEMIRVPLLVRGPGVVARVIETPVSLVDVGPTVLDIFGVGTPATFEGQSLVPLLRGDDGVSFERPILSEGRLRRAIVTPDGMKVTIDLRRKTLEAFDLVVDPGETNDLWDTGSERARRAAATLVAYYEAREVRDPAFARVYRR